MVENEIEQFLKEIEVINFKFQKNVENSHSNFNIFSILRNESDEEKLHSAFIGELLNPKGSHGMGSIFLDLFIDVIKKDEINFNSNETSLEVEKWIGKKSEDNSKGGRIDIFISDGETNLAIENKIYAHDQPKQLLRYHKYIKSKLLFYLTLYGSNPSVDSTSNLILGKNFFNISYEYHILKWLKSCKEKVVDYPTIRETIEQYIKLVKKLTGQSLSEKHIMKLAEFLIKDSTNLKLAKNIEEALVKAEILIQFKFWESLTKSLMEIINNKDYIQKDYSKKIIYDYYNSRNNTYHGINIFVKNYTGAYKIYFRIEIEADVYFGFQIYKGNTQVDVSNEKHFKELFDIIAKMDKSPFKREKYWIGWKFPQKHKNHGLDFKNFNSDVIFSLANSEKLRIITDELAMEVKEIINDFYSKSV